MAWVAGTMLLLGVLVWALHPSQPHFTPAPLKPMPPDCPKLVPDFTPTNYTEIPDLPLDSLLPEQKNRVLFRLNMEPCPCGCNLSLADCRFNHPTCERARELARKILAEEQSETRRPPHK